MRNSKDLNYKRWKFQVVAMGDHFYALGGQTDNGIELNQCERIRISTVDKEGNWYTDMSSMKQSRKSFAAIPLQNENKIIVIGNGCPGEKNSKITQAMNRSMEIYDAIKN